MVKLVALYKKPANIQEFDQHYFDTHLPLAAQIPGLKRVEVSKISGSPAGESEYHLIAEMYFENMDALKAGMSSPEGKASGKDLMSFAKDVVYMMFAEVEEKVPAIAR
jgi:uncharacterized protein (TIGR02118 family)